MSRKNESHGGFLRSKLPGIYSPRKVFSFLLYPRDPYISRKLDMKIKHCSSEENRQDILKTLFVPLEIVFERRRGEANLGILHSDALKLQCIRPYIL